MFHLKVTDDAVADLVSIADYIRPDNPTRAESFIYEITEKFRTIAERPLSFPDKSYLLRGARSALHGRYLIFFRIDNEIVEILRVVHSARDLESTL